MAKVCKIIFLIFFSSVFLTAQNNDFRFEHLTVEDGLSNNFVRSIVQDSMGFMWFATEDGLNKYDGYTFTVYRNDPNDSTSLGENIVEVLQIDKNGIIWVGTNGGGLNAFNPQTEKFTPYNIYPDDMHDISKDYIYDLYIDKNGHLWISVWGKGLYRLDPETNNITHYEHNPEDPNSISSNFGMLITSTVNEGKELMWIGSWGGGLNKLDVENNQWTHYMPNPEVKNSLHGLYIDDVYTDNSGLLWISTSWNGLNKLDPQTEIFTNYRNDPSNPNSLSHNMVGQVWEKDGVLWITTMAGLNRLNINNEELKSYIHNPSVPASIGQNSVWRIYESKSGVIWIGGWAGIDIIDFEQKPFTSYQKEPGNPNSLSDYFAGSILETKQQNYDILWIGTKDGGLNKLNRQTGQFTHYQHNPADPNSVSDNFIFGMSESSYKGKNELWLGTLSGLNRFDPQTGKFRHYRHNPDDSTSISENLIHAVYAGRNEYIWVGTQNQGLCRFDLKTEQFKRYQHSTGEIWIIYEDTSGYLWYGSNRDGLLKLDPLTDEVTYYSHNPQDTYSISSNTIRSIHESFTGGKHVLWVGTNTGLNRFDYQTEQFKHYSRKDGLPNNEINGILEDTHGNLWLSSGHGLSKFDPASGSIRNYDKNDGLPGNQFLRGCYFQGKNGEMFFSCTNGFTAFFPEQIKDNLHIPEIVLTDFQIFNKSVPVKNDGRAESDNYSLSRHISSLSQIELSYDQSVFSFEFAALDYRKPQKNRYAYMMEGVDPDWVHTDASRRFATYTNLDPGEYTFRVKGSNNDGIWNEEGTSIKVIITPPWWRTNLAYILYFVFFIVVIAATWRSQLRRIRFKQQLQMKHIQTEKQEEIDRMKSRFFANISHEFRTPLTLIEGPIRQMLWGEFKGNMKEQFKMILRNSGRLLTLINQLLDLSKLESGKLKLKARATDIVSHTNALVQAFESLAVKEDIQLKISTNMSEQEVYIDIEKYETIINNLLSNAFKFTPENGIIEVKLNISNHAGRRISLPADAQAQMPNQIQNRDFGFCQINISNTGSGISSDQIKHVFDRFYQADDSYRKDEHGTGIGLALTKELVELHHGEIWVESEPDSATIFHILLPLGKEHFSEDEFAVSDTRVPESGVQYPEFPIKTPPSSQQIGIKSSRIRPASTILIVEDNADLRRYINQNMSQNFSIIEAENGEEGFDAAIKEMPDLIISDIMMPVMNGIQFCAKIKTDERTSHIPVILLTAKADMDSRLEGLEHGADDYITKPFEMREVRTRVENLIEQRRKLREKFSRVIEVNPGEITASSHDEKFLKRLIDIFEAHIDDSDFRTKDFAREVGMSRSNLHRKLIALTNQPTHEFLRTLRLKRAAQLLKQAAGTVTEIAYAVGFANPSYFSKIFRQQFGQTPTEFANRNQLSDTSEM